MSSTTKEKPVLNAEPAKAIALTIYFHDAEELDVFHRLLDTIYQQNRHIPKNDAVGSALSAALWAILCKKKRT